MPLKWIFVFSEINWNLKKKNPKRLQSVVFCFRPLQDEFSTSLFLVYFMFSGRWRVISVQTDGESRRGAPEATDARSDQAEFCSRRAEWRTATFGFDLFIYFFSPLADTQVQCWRGNKKRKNTQPSLQRDLPDGWFHLFHLTSKIPLCGCAVDKPPRSGRHVCCAPPSRRCELFCFWPESKQTTTKKKKSKCQQSLVLIKHPVPNW